MLEGSTKGYEVLLAGVGRVHQKKGEVRSAKQGLVPFQRLRHISRQGGADIGFQREMQHEGNGEQGEHRTHGEHLPWPGDA